MLTSLVRQGDRRVAAFLFVAALVLYAPGIWWGVPQATAFDRIRPWGSDETAPLGPVAELYSVFVNPYGRINPQYPLFHYFVQAGFVVPYLAGLRLAGGLTRPSVDYPYGLVDPTTALAWMTLAARVASWLMASAVVVVAFRSGMTLWDRRTGIVAGLFVLLIYPMFYYSRTSNVDMGALFWTSLGLAVFAACLKDTLTRERAAWLGVFAALATATKDQSYGTFAAVALVLVPRHVRQQRTAGASWWEASAVPILAAATAVTVYAIASGLVFDVARYRAHLDFIIHGSPYTRGVTYFASPRTAGGYLRVLGDVGIHLVDALGLPLVVCTLVGLGLCLRAPGARLWFAAPALGSILGVVIPTRFALFRFVLTAAYVLSLFGAFGVVTVMQDPRPAMRRLGRILLLAAAGWALVRGADLTFQMVFDSRYEVARWFRQHASAGDRVGYYGAPDKLPRLAAGIVTAPMPGQPVPEHLRYPPSLRSIARPEFIVVIPLEAHDVVHERVMPDEVYRALVDGTAGYRLAVDHQTDSLFSKRPVTYVNPPVKVFVRDDRPR